MNELIKEAGIIILMIILVSIGIWFTTKDNVVINHSVSDDVLWMAEQLPNTDGIFYANIDNEVFKQVFDVDVKDFKMLMAVQTGSHTLYPVSPSNKMYWIIKARAESPLVLKSIAQLIDPVDELNISQNEDGYYIIKPKFSVHSKKTLAKNKDLSKVAIAQGIYYYSPIAQDMFAGDVGYKDNAVIFEFSYINPLLKDFFDKTVIYEPKALISKDATWFYDGSVPITAMGLMAYAQTSPSAAIVSSYYMQFLNSRQGEIAFSGTSTHTVISGANYSDVYNVAKVLERMGLKVGLNEDKITHGLIFVGLDKTSFYIIFGYHETMKLVHVPKIQGLLAMWLTSDSMGRITYDGQYVNGFIGVNPEWLKNFVLTRREQ